MVLAATVVVILPLPLSLSLVLVLILILILQRTGSAQEMIVSWAVWAGDPPWLLLDVV